MIELNKSKYPAVLPFLKQVEFNYLFAESVLKNVVNGKVYVDCEESPTSFYVLHSYGMSLLLGNENNPAFNLWLKNYLLNKEGKRMQEEWLQVFPDVWHNQLSKLLGKEIHRKTKRTEIANEKVTNQVIENTRVNFQFNYNLYMLFRKNINLQYYNITKTSAKLFHEMEGVVVPKAFWKSAKLFKQSGIGFSLFIDGRLASTAYSAFIHNGQLELGIETVTAFQGKGLAAICCAALIDYCIENNFEPVWSCKLENTASFKLALKLGFKPISYRPYYRVKP